jgi:conjugal transfer/type IV secretion protein DotA/TraY
MMLTSSIAFLITFLTNAAYAQTGGTAPAPLTDFSAPESDYSMSLVQALFSEVLGSNTTSSSGSYGMLGGFFFVLNSACLVAGGALFFYTAVVGILRTAQDGQILGQKWDSMWVPFRFVVFSALLVPMSSGFSLAQVGALGVATFGVGVADKAFSYAMNGLIQGQSYSHFVGSAGDDATVKAVVRQTLVGMICDATMAQHYDPSFSQGSSGSVFVPTAVTGSNGALTIQFGSAYPGTPVAMSEAVTTFPEPTSCGTIVFAGVTPPAANVGAATQQSFQQLSTNAAIQGISRNATQIMQNAEARGVMAAAQAMAGFANAYVQQCTVDSSGNQNCSSTLPDSQVIPQLANAFKNGQSAYLQAIQAGESQVQTLMNGPNANYLSQGFISDAESIGWMGAGMWFFRIAALETELKRSVGFTPSFTDPQIDPSDVTGMRNPAGFTNEVNQVIAQVIDPTSGQSLVPATVTGGPPTGPMASSLKISNPTDAMNQIKKGMDPSVEFAYFFGTMLGNDPTSSVHPLIQIKTMGDSILTYADMMLGFFLAVNAAAFVAVGVGSSTILGTGDPGLATAAMGILAPLQTIFGLVLGAVYSIGIMLAVVMPLTPFITWFGGVIGWFVSLAELMVITPIAIAGHLDPEGHDVTGRGGAIYMVALEVVARPILMLAGLLFGCQLMWPLTKAFSYCFFMAASVVQAGASSLTWQPYAILTGIAMMSIYISITHTIVKKCFSLIQVFPAAAFRVIGGHGSPHHDGAGDMGAAMESAAAGSTKYTAGAGAFLGSQGKSVVPAGTAVNQRIAQKLAEREIGRGASGDSNPDPAFPQGSRIADAGLNFKRGRYFEAAASLFQHGFKVEGARQGIEMGRMEQQVKFADFQDKLDKHGLRPASGAASAAAGGEAAASGNRSPSTTVGLGSSE